MRLDADISAVIAYAPGLIAPKTRISQMILNTDIAPTLLELASVVPPANHKLDGKSFLPLLKGKETPWRDRFIYSYFWEWNFPAVPTTLAIRNERYKYIYYHGVWDRNGFYDLKTDPIERHNLIKVPAYQKQIAEMREQMFKELSEAGGLNIPVRVPAGDRLDQRKLRR